MGTAYERELKGILAGEESVLRKASISLKPEEAKRYRHTLDSPFLVVRGAGSLGVDLVALRQDFSFPIEVKSSAKDVIPFSASSGKNHDQALEMARTCAAAGVVPLYAFRLKGHVGDAWRIFSLPMEDLFGRQRLLYRRLPKVELTDQGNFILRWADGMPLNELLGYLAHLTA